MSIDAGNVRREGSDQYFTDRREREMQRRQEERMPGVPVREWVGRLVAGFSAARDGVGFALPRPRRGES